MDYKKKYNEALERANKYNFDGAKQVVKDLVFYIFPELQESEDERIRKEILQSIRDNMVVIHKDKCIAWIEKQEGCEYIKKDWLEHIKQSWYKEGFIDGKYSGGTSKEWTINDAATLKELIDFLENGTAKLQHDLTKYANWLKIQFTPIEKQGEQESTDKHEPKFNVYDWCIDNEDDIIFQIMKVLDNTYTYRTNEGKEYSCTHYSLENEARHWTIQDAKDGDVLASNRSIFIFSQEYIAGKPEAYCGIMNGLFIAKSEGCWTNEECYPATKEQCDILFTKMKEIGYEWDADKKKLKKISQRMVSAEAKEALYDKPTWSVEDMSKVQRICKYLDEAKKYYADITEVRECIDWLKSLKDKVQPQPKQEWSEEDEAHINSIIDYLLDYKLLVYEEDMNVANGVQKELDWLKSLQRIGG